MKQFTMSMYSSKEDLYKARAAYYQDLVDAMAERLLDIDEIDYDASGEYYWTASGELLVEDVNTKIKEVFTGHGRKLFECEKPIVDAFNHKYSV